MTTGILGTLHEFACHPCPGAMLIESDYDVRDFRTFHEFARHPCAGAVLIESDYDDQDFRTAS